MLKKIGKIIFLFNNIYIEVSLQKKIMQDGQKVTQVGFHFQGLVDIDTFQRKMYRLE